MPNPKGVPANLKKFVKGQSGNPLGGKLHDPVKRAIKRLTTREIKDLSGMILNGNVEELQAVAKDKKASVIKVMLAACAVKIIQKGDAQSLNVILDRLIGKVPNPVRLSGGDGGPVEVAESVRVVIKLPSNGREKISPKAE